MKLKLFTILFIFSLIGITACSSASDQVKQPEPVVKQQANDENEPVEEVLTADPATVKAANQQLVNVLNDRLTVAVMSGFGNGKTHLSAKKEANWVKKNIQSIKDIVASLPEGLALEVTGHSDSSVTKQKYAIITRAEASIQRAQYAFSILEKNNVDTSKVEVEGKSDTQPIEGKKTTDPANRRVTFKVILTE